MKNTSHAGFVLRIKAKDLKARRVSRMYVKVKPSKKVYKRVSRHNPD